MNSPAAVTDPCPCGLPAGYRACCGRWHAGARYLQAPSAEALMRSRYSAFVRELGDYLRETWHPSTRPAAALTFDPGLRWLGLTVRQVRALPDGHATVEFVARSKVGGRPAQRLHETSRFMCEQGRWFYVDGDIG